MLSSAQRVRSNVCAPRWVDPAGDDLQTGAVRRTETFDESSLDALTNRKLKFLSDFDRSLSDPFAHPRSLGLTAHIVHMNTTKCVAGSAGTSGSPGRA